MKKIFFLIAWLGMFILALLGLNYAIMPHSLAFDPMYLGSLNSFSFKIILIVISVIYIFLCIYRFLCLFERTTNFRHSTENGEINISPATLNAFVLDLLRRDSSIEGSKVNSYSSGKKILIEIKTNVVKAVNTLEKVSEIQNLVKNEVQRSVGLSVHDVKVHILKVSALNSNETNTNYASEVSYENINEVK